MKLLIRFAIAFLVITVAAALYLSHEYNQYIHSTPDNKNEKRLIVIEQGESIPKIIAKLEENGVIVGAKKFYYFARLNKKLRAFKFGEYEFTTSMRPIDVVNKLITGEIKKYKLTIPEGYNIYQVADVFFDKMGISRDDFLERCMSKDFTTRMGINAPMLEGYLFPDTYYFNKNMSLDDMILKMVWNFKLHFDKKMRARAKELGMTRHEITTLASIIEKETSKVSEMSIISGVFHNRLKINMMLQSDPTVIYGIADFDGNVTRKHLRTFTAYNTYKIKGFPPTPIANPGLAALKAALNPADVPYLFFVSKNNGSHYFSETFGKHKKAVRKFQVRGEVGK